MRFRAIKLKQFLSAKRASLSVRLVSDLRRRFVFEAQVDILILQSALRAAHTRARAHHGRFITGRKIDN